MQLYALNQALCYCYCHINEYFGPNGHQWANLQRQTLLANVFRRLILIITTNDMTPRCPPQMRTRNLAGKLLQRFTLTAVVALVTRLMFLGLVTQLGVIMAQL